MAAKVKLSARERSKKKIRRRITGVGTKPRLSVFRSNQHMYAQAIDDVTGATLVSASTLDSEVKELLQKVDVKGLVNETRSTKSCAGAKAVGLVLAARAKSKGLTEVVFDRNGFIYHGRIKAIADGAREGGLKF